MIRLVVRMEETTFQQPASSSPAFPEVSEWPRGSEREVG